MAVRLDIPARPRHSSDVKGILRHQSWNRLAISTRAVPGHYKPAKAAASSS